MFIENCVSKSLLISLALAVALAGPSLHSQVASVSSDSALTPQAPSSNQPSPNPANPLTLERTHEEVLERHFAVNIIEDQEAIWTSPLHLKKRDLFWLLPSAAILGESLHRDAYLYRALTPAVNTGTRSKTFSDAGVAAFAAGTAGMYLFGRLHDSDHQRETAVLATEALADSMTVGYALKYTLNRERPFNGNGNGDFFVPGGGGSFPSSHALAAWSIASVIAHEYPGPLTKISVYGLATAISVSRVTGRQHFPSDVLVGSAIGWGIGAITYRMHHDSELPGVVARDSFVPSAEETDSSVGSTDVELDSWVYPAFDRLAALGLIDSEFSGQRPWSRTECVRLIAEAESALASVPRSRSAADLVHALEAEFSHDNEASRTHTMRELNIESVYTRIMGISGPPLTDGYHFGQTLYDDFGRPYGQGLNAIFGFSGSARSGHWSAYVKAEFQHAPSPEVSSPAVLEHISLVDFTPLQPAPMLHDADQGRLLEAYVAYTSANWRIAIGKQSLWWSPDQYGALMFSSNVEGINMARFSRVHPAVLPSLLHYLGPLQVEAFLGQLSGQKFVFINGVGTFEPPLSRQPLIDGGKLSFKPTRNFEFGVSFTTIFAGPGVALNARTFLNSLSLGNTLPGFIGDPGDRRAGFDFKYRVPWLRDKLTAYADSFSEDEISPIAYPRRSAMNLGFYLPELFGFRKLDVRAEGMYTDLPGLQKVGFLYANDHFLSGYTDRGQIIGDWIGRQGSGYKADTTYHVNGTASIDFGLRRTRVSEQFLPEGGNLWDISARPQWQLTKSLRVEGMVQYERWNYPLLAAAPQRNITTTIELRFHPSLQR